MEDVYSMARIYIAHISLISIANRRAFNDHPRLTENVIPVSMVFVRGIQ